jgi:hypothetical protein
MAFTKLEDGYMNMYLNTIYQTDDSQPQDAMLAAGPIAEPDGQVTVSGVQPQQVKTDVQPALGVARPIPQNKAQEALGYIGELLTKAGVQLDKVGIEIPVLGRVSLKDLTVGESGKVLEDMALGFYPIEGAGGFISGTTRIKPDPALELLNIAPIATATAKVAGKGVVKAGQAVAPKAAEMAEGYLRSIGGVADIVPINPAKFKPAEEVKSAIDVVSKDPINSIYLPQAQLAPSVALRLAKPEIIGTGKNNLITVEDVGTVLEKAQLSLYKNKPLDPNNPKDLTKMIDSASAEADFQLSQPITGANWYDDDVANAFKMSAKIVPELATDEPLRVLTTAFAASTSYNKRAGENWAVATKITEHLLKTGKVATRNPENGKLWAGTTGPIMEQQLKFHEFMLNKMGLADYAEWLLTPHAVKDIKAMKAESGLYKTIDVPGKATDMKMGSFVIGEKGGAFFLNLNGIKETTADKWFTRTYNRHAGSLTSGNISEQGLIDAPRNEAERSIMKEWNRGVASNSKLDEQANQAVLWFYEQNLYYNLGVKSAKSESFSDGARNLLNARGVQFDESELIKSRSRSNAPETGAESTSPTTTGNPVGVGEVAPVSTKPATVTRGKTAPSKGAE